MIDYESGTVVEEDAFQMSIPDKYSAYLTLQLYKRKIVWENVSPEELDEEYDMQESLNPIPLYGEEETYGWEPVGDLIRIQIK